ncbi:MAG: type II toxin-antitoxin system HicA family toxin [Verrucomicrobiia bacterium]
MSPRLPAITAKDLVRFLKRQGFVEDRQRGSHLVLFHPATNRTVVVPMHSGDLGRGLSRAVLKDAGFSVEDYLRLR